MMLNLVLGPPGLVALMLHALLLALAAGSLGLAGYLGLRVARSGDEDSKVIASFGVFVLLAIAGMAFAALQAVSTATGP